MEANGQADPLVGLIATFLQLVPSDCPEPNIKLQTLRPTLNTVAWGYYDANVAPVRRVISVYNSGIQHLITNSPIGWKRLAYRRIKWNNRCGEHHRQ